MRILQILLISTLFVSAKLSLPANFITDFQQIITNDKGKVIKYSGKLYFKQESNFYVDEFKRPIEIKNQMFKWEYKTPTQKEVCSDGVEIVVVDHDLEQVSRYLIDDGLDLEKVLGLAEAVSTRDYKAVYKDTEYLITLDSQNRLKKIFYVDNLDNKVKILFFNIKYNIPNFKSSNLKCKIDPSYDIIEE